MSGRGGRTLTRLPSADFESAASASSAIPALPINSPTRTIFDQHGRQAPRSFTGRSVFRFRPSHVASSLFQYRIALPVNTLRPKATLPLERRSNLRTSPAQPASTPLRQTHTPLTFSEAPDRYASPWTSSATHDNHIRIQDVDDLCQPKRASRSSNLSIAAAASRSPCFELRYDCLRRLRLPGHRSVVQRDSRARHPHLQAASLAAAARGPRILFRRLPWRQRIMPPFAGPHPVRSFMNPRVDCNSAAASGTKNNPGTQHACPPPLHPWLLRPQNSLRRSPRAPPSPTSRSDPDPTDAHSATLSSSSSSTSPVILEMLPGIPAPTVPVLPVSLSRRRTSSTIAASVAS